MISLQILPLFIWLPTKEEEMETQKVTVILSKNKKLESLIMTFFEKSGGMFECKKCSKILRGYNFILKQHLKLKHGDLWNVYLSQLDWKWPIKQMNVASFPKQLYF